MKECVVCGILHVDSHFHWHHIDRNRKNNCRENLIELCIDCHRDVHRRIRNGADNHAAIWGPKPEGKKIPVVEGTIILKRDVVDTLPEYYRVAAYYLRDRGRAIIV